MMTVVRLLRALTETKNDSETSDQDAECGSPLRFQEDSLPEGASRADLWRRLADEIHGGPPPQGLYATLLSRSSGDGAAASHVRKQIEKDVRSSMPKPREGCHDACLPPCALPRH